MAIEPPLKKRKHYDGDTSLTSGTGGTSANAQVQRGAISEEQKLRKRANMDEIGAFYKTYRRLKFCLDSKRAAGSLSASDLEEAYCSILNLSTGCSSVQRIAAELIPRYAVFCPGAIDLASNTLIQILEWSEDRVFQEEDFDGVAFKTAQACLSGMVELSSAAVKAEESPEISDMSLAMCQNMAFYMLCRLEGRDPPNFHLAEYHKKVAACIESGTPMQEKLLDLVSINLVKLLHTHPRSIFSACFDLLGSHDMSQRKKGQHFLSQIMKIVNQDPSEDEGVVAAARTEGNKGDLMKGGGSLSMLSLDHNQMHHADSLFGQVVYSNSVLERWIVAAFRKFHNSASPEVVTDSLPLLTSLIQSLSTFKESDLDPSHEEELETEEIVSMVQDPPVEPEGDMKSPLVTQGMLSPSRIISCPTNAATRSPNSCKEDSGGASLGRPHVALNLAGASESGDVKEKSMEESSLETSSAPVTTINHHGLDVDNGLAKLTKFPTEHDGDVELRSMSSLNYLPFPSKSQEPQPFASTQKVTCRDVDMVDYTHHEDKAKVEVSSPQGFPVSGGTLDSSFSQRQVAWYSDGDPAALDVFAASKQLWVGSLGHGVTESLLRYEFEKFGPLESLSLFPGRDFALVEYKSLNDAVKAREVLQGAAPWLIPLKIKFLDVGLGSRGTIGGVAVGGSCHVYVGGALNLSAKDEIIKDMAHSCLKVPRSVCVLVSARALLMEFDAPEEAAAAMLHIRQRRRENGYISLPLKYSEKTPFPSMHAGGEGVGGSRLLWVGHVDHMVSEQELLSAFSEYGEITGCKFSRESACCIIEFRFPEAATCAKAKLDGVRFGSQYIQVDDRRSPPTGATAPRASSSSPGGFYSLSTWPIPRSHNTVLTGNSCARSVQSPRGGTQMGFRNRGPLPRVGRDSERPPSNTLWVGFPDHTVQSLPTDAELKAIMNLSCKGLGMVTKMSSVRSSRGSCRFVEFDSVEGAAMALQNCGGYLDPGTQIEFSSTSFSHQHGDYPHTIVTPLNEDLWSLLEKDHDWDRRPRPSSNMAHHDSAKMSGLHGNSALQTGWGQTHFGGNPDNNKFRYNRGGHSHYEVATELLKTDSMVGSYIPSANSKLTSTSMENQLIPPGGSHAWLGSSRSLDRHLSVGVGLDLGAPQLPSLTPLPHIDRLSSTGSWPTQGLIASSSVIDSGVNPSLPGPFLQSPVTPILPRLPGGLPRSFEQVNPPYPPLPPISPPPPPPLETPPPPPPPLSPPPPPPPYHLPSAAPPPPVSPPPPLPAEFIKYDGMGHSKQPYWQGPLCKSGYQYCEVLVYHEHSAVCQNDAFHEPAGWPTKLDVTKRADFRSVRYSFQNTSRNQREVCRLFVGSGSNNFQGFQQFESYLRQRDRAGVVMIPETGKIWARILFILPWSRDICDLLMISHQPTDGLIGLLLPMDTSFS